MFEIEPTATGKAIITIVGPTASGKSALGIALAKHLDGEIINLDSVQVYKGLYIATAKVTKSEMQNIPHHLIDVVEPTENFTAGDYARQATRIIAEIELRSRYALLVGGTGFYLRALQGALFDEEKPTNLKLREKLKTICERRGAAHLHKMLTRLDKLAAIKIAPNDWSRTIRALEVYFQTGRSITEWQQKILPTPAFAARISIFALNPPRDALYEKINTRVNQMFEQGLIDEVENLLKEGVPHNAKAFGAHGYRRVVEYLQGLRSLESCIEQTKLDTRHYAKRQLTWWRHTKEVTWLNGFGQEERLLEEALKTLANNKMYS
ncbi:MAG: tRNA (adenosine(37)-N6)-dimethylallyltransferase MiaA [Acidobacteria bacterium]|nr:tRNA (adenosine(37)-N6)-dimethylallyltransferase MiaA [Acidobacteriota bacterium]